MWDERNVRCFSLRMLIQDIETPAVPSISDQEMLPQVTAFMLESLRWRPVSIGGARHLLTRRPCGEHLMHAAGFAHRATTDIVWENYLIPKGATVIGNHWYVLRGLI